MHVQYLYNPSCLQLNRFIRIMRRALARQLFTLWLLFRRFRRRWFSFLHCALRAFSSCCSSFATPAFPALGAFSFGLYTFQRAIHFTLQVMRVDRFRLLRA
jgi:hypothetical protein